MRLPTPLEEQQKCRVPWLCVNGTEIRSVGFTVFMSFIVAA